MKIVGKIELEPLLKRLNEGHLLPILVILIFFTSLYIKIINFFFFSDDFHHLLVNKNISLFDTFSFKTQAYSNPNLYRPTTNIYFSVMENFFGTNPMPYYIVLFLIGLLTSVFLYLLIYKLISKKIPSLVGALFFSVFPSHIDPISWNANICDALLGLSVVLIIFFLLNYFENNKFYWILLSITFIFVALISKEAAVGLIFPLLFLVFLEKKYFKTFFIYLMVTLPFIFYFLLRLFYSSYISTNQILVSYKVPVVNGLLHYINSFFELSARLFVLPNNLPNVYRFSLVSLIYVGLLIVIIYIKQKKVYIFGFLLMVFTIVPSVTVEYYFDRYVYVSGLGLVIMLSATMSEVVPKYYKKVTLIILLPLLFLYIFNTKRVEMVSEASEVSRVFVEKIEKTDIRNLALVPSYYHKDLFKYWKVDQLIISEKSHPREIVEFFYGKNIDISVKTTGILTEKNYTIQLQNSIFTSSNMLFNKEQNDLLLKQKAIDGFFNGSEFHKVSY